MFFRRMNHKTCQKESESVSLIDKSEHVFFPFWLLNLTSVFLFIVEHFQLVALSTMCPAYMMCPCRLGHHAVICVSQAEDALWATKIWPGTVGNRYVPSMKAGASITKSIQPPERHKPSLHLRSCSKILCIRLWSFASL